MTAIERGPAAPARCEAETVQDVLARDRVPPPAVLREESWVDLGLDDVPVERYTSPDWHRRELERLWGRTWQVACREERLVEPGDHVVYEVGDLSLIVARTPSGAIKAFHNSCLHRGTTLRVEGGHVGAFRCPFHGFTWDLEGDLRTIPSAWDFPHVERSRSSLPEAQVGTWGGWVFVNPDLGAGPLAEHLGRFPEMFPWRQEDLVTQAHVVKELRCNWKVALEAFIESYHVIATHPQLLDLLGDANTQYDVWPDEPRWSRMITPQAVPSPHLRGARSEQDVVDAMVALFVGPGLQVPVPEGSSAREVMAGFLRAPVVAALGPDVQVSESEVLDAIEYYVFPNLVPWGGFSRINYRFLPLGDDPGACTMDVVLLGPFDPARGRPAPAPVQRLGADEPWTAAEGLGALALIFEQDTANLPRVQRGLRASRKPGVTLGAYQESRIRHLHQELGRWVDG